ncbi:30S ribosomal protein S2 [Candidatus Vidania fulgoroideorum]
MIRYIKILKKIKANLSNCKRTHNLNSKVISYKNNFYFIDLKHTLKNLINSSIIMRKYIKRKKDILVITDNKLIHKEIKNINKNLKISNNISFGNFTNFNTLAKENRKHRVLLKILDKSKKKNKNIYRKVKNNIKNKPVEIYKIPSLILDLRIKKKKFFKECNKINIKVISFLNLEDNNKYSDIPIYFNLKSILCIRVMLKIMFKICQK